MISIKTKLTIFAIFFLFSLGFISHAQAATEFTSIVDPGGAGDYSSLSAWETGVQTDLTAATTQVFSGIITGTAPADNATVYLCRSGAYQNHSATVVHTTSSQILLETITGAATEQANDVWYTNNTCNSASYFTLSGAQAAGDSPIAIAKCRTSNGAADTAAVAIDGWTTSATNYIKIWTDPAENYRHKGVWDISKYRLEAGGYSLRTYEEYSRIDGLQVFSSASSSVAGGIIVSPTTSTTNVQVSNNIIKGIFSGTASATGIFMTTSGTSYVWNNDVYGFINGAYNCSGIATNGASSIMYSYSNTLYGNSGGLSRNNGTIYAKNNLSYNNTDNYNGSFDAASTNNLSGPGSDAQIAGQSNSQNGVTVTFADEANNDFHLDSSDTGAKNHGANLYADANIPMTTDIDGNARFNDATKNDIGADENVAAIYRSVGAGATAPLATGGSSTYGYMEIKPTYLSVGSTANLTDHIATFWRPLPDNIGVGDAIQYDTNNTGGIDKVVFITRRIDSTHYSVRKADGTAPDATTDIPNSTWGIYRSYISLFNAEAGTENTALSDGIENFDTGNVNLTTNNSQWNFPCYANGTAADTTAVDINGWTVSIDNYIRIYTPTRNDEVGASQRHSGKWDNSKYNLQTGTGVASIVLTTSYVFIDGLQVYNSGTASTDSCITRAGYRNHAKIGNSIIKGGYIGIAFGVVGATDGDDMVYNSFVYNSYSTAISLTGATGHPSYAYNNTVYNWNVGAQAYAHGISAYLSSVDVMRNNISYTATHGGLDTRDFFGSNQSYNISSDNSASGTGSLINKNLSDIKFVSTTAGSEDLHILPGSIAQNVGTNFSNDLNLPINSDIDSTGSGTERRSAFPICQTTDESCLTRPYATSWDIGADELITKIYRSVGVGTTAAIITGTSPAISLTISGNIGTFSTFPTSAAFGVGDVIRYDSDNNGTNDATAFITAIDSTAKTATLQAADGSTPAAMAVADYDWKLYRAYTSLSAWESGTENVGVGVTYDAGNLDIASRSEQWHIAAYSPAGTDTTAPDTTGVTISGWTTKPQNYIKVYTPTSLTEVTTSQRHQGKWDTNKYHLEVDNNNAIYTRADYLKVEGLQIKVSHSLSSAHGIYTDTISSNNKLEVSNNIITGVFGVGAYYGSAIITNDGDVKAYIWNNIINDWVNGTTYGCFGIDVYTLSAGYVYSNTSVNNYITLRASLAASVIAKNNVVQSSASGYSGTFNPSSDYNISSDATAPGSHSKNGTTVSFVDVANKDFHLAPTDTVARNAGADLSHDIYFPITTDIDGNIRVPSASISASDPRTWDIGADEAATAIYRSIAPGATGNIGTSAQGGIFSISGNVGTFTTAPGTHVGVGDAVQYDSDNNGSIDSIAFISARNSATEYVLQSHDGGLLTATSVADSDWQLFRAYTTLDNAEGGVENSGIADAVEHFDQDVGAGDGKDIYASNQQWNIAAYANSTTADTARIVVQDWTTTPNNYLKVYTPTVITEVGISQRAQGKWDDSKYRLTTTNQDNIVYVNNVKFNGLQFDVTAVADYYTPLWIRGVSSGIISVSNNIFKQNSSSTKFIFGIYYHQSSANIEIYNNVFYDITNGSNNGVGVQYSENAGGAAYVYNNSFYNCFRGISKDTGGSVLAKNNIVQGANDGYYGTFVSGSDYNISNLANDAPSPSYRNNLATTVSFVDAANKDFHLAASDTAARNAGADLSADANLAFSTDVDGHTRNASAHTGAWDIGADEGATHIYYSVGQSTAPDMKTGTPTITLVGIGATFNTAQTGNIGVGDKVTYTGGECYISGKISTTQWNCQNVTGGTAPQVSGVSVTSIKRAFDSLEHAVDAATANGAQDSTHLNTADLYANNYVLNVPCYYDTGADTTAVAVEGWTTAVPNYIKIYTPSSASSEVNNSQRHQGKWDDGKYKLVHSNIGISINNSNVKIDGLQVTGTASFGIYAARVTFPQISNCVIRNSGHGIYLANSGALINNCLIYGNAATGIYNSSNSGGMPSIAHNSTIVSNLVGVSATGGSVTLKNDLFQGNTTDAGGTSSSYCATNNDSSKGLPAGTGNRYSQTFTFADSANADYHLAQTDSGAKNYGANLSADSNFAFSTDIDGSTRNTDGRGWDIGADESATQVFYSVGQSSTDLKTGTPTLDITSGAGTFSVAQTANIGVGDRVTYNTDKIAYIAAKTNADSAHWTLLAATGALPPDVSGATVNSITHTFTTLNAAFAGSDTLLGTGDLQANNYQLNIPCYYDNAADTTAVNTTTEYTTGPTTYIKAYTPTSTTAEVNNSQRHSGKWDEGKYNISPAINLAPITITSSHAFLEGIQVRYTANLNNYDGAISLASGNGSLAAISNTIIRGDISGAANNIYGIKTAWNTTGSRTLKIYNNIIYGFNLLSNRGIYNDQTWNTYLYNNTFYGNSVGIYANLGNVVAKNNISYNNTDNYYGAFNASSTNNLSGPGADAQIPATNARNGVTVNFVDAPHGDFHLAWTDTSAREAGADLRTDANLPVTTDIDGNSRPTLGATDIGADEGATHIFYSVGQNTDDHKTGTPNITIASGVATFSVAQTATNMGVGDEITYNTTSKAYITQKIDTSQWRVETATGATPANVSGQTVNQIAHAFSNLSATNTGAGNSTHLNSQNLSSNNYVLNIPCYYDTGADNNAVQLNNWTTGSNNYIRIYTPTNTSTESNLSQRHSGKWDDSKYRLEVSTTHAIQNYVGHIRFDGLQIKELTSNNGIYTVVTPNSARIEISNNIITTDGTAGTAISNNGNGGFFIWNNLIYGGFSSGYAINIYGTDYVYNNTIIGSSVRSQASSGITAENNIFQSVTVAFVGTLNPASANNIVSSISSGQGAFGVTADSGTATSASASKLIQSGQNFRTTVKVGQIVKDSGSGYAYVTAIDSDTQLSLSSDIMGNGEAFTIYTNKYGTVNFVSTDGKDFHLTDSDTLAKSAGVDLSNDSNLYFNTDIDSQVRVADDWDIGADQFYAGTMGGPADGQDDSSAEPIAHYTFNEGVGSTANNSGSGGASLNGSLGTGNSSPSWSNDGKFGKALSFDGTNDYASVANIDLSGTDKVSVSFWIKYTDSATTRIVYEYSANFNSNNAFLVTLNETYQRGGIGLGSRSSDYNLVYTANDYNDGNWHHVVCEIDRSQGGTSENTIYVDGKKDTVQHGIYFNDLSGNFGGPYPFYFGSRAGSSYIYSGSLDDFKIYNYALSADQVKREFDGGYAMQMGSSGSVSGTGVPTNAASGEYCVPGDTTSCAAPVGEWKMDEKVSGDAKTLNDTSGNGNNGTTNDGANNAGMNCSVQGKYGSGCQFDGVDDYVGMGSDVGSISSGTFTISGYVYLTATPTNAMSIVGGSTHYPALTVTAARKLGLAKEGVAWVGGGNTVLNLNQWYFASASYDGSNWKIYLDGKLDGSGTNAQTFVSSNTRIGYYYYSSTAEYFSGKIDNVRIYNYVRSASQIAWEYNKGKPIAEWRMNETSGDTVHDDATNTYTGTRQNMEDGDWAEGKHGNALSFDGSDEYVSVADSPGLNFPSDQNFTISAFVKRADLTTHSNGAVLSKGGTSNGRYWFGVEDESGTFGTLYVNTYYGTGGTDHWLRITNNFKDTDWHHIVWVVNKKTLTHSVYYDGVETNSAAVSNGNNTRVEELWIGKGPNGRFFGQIDDLKIFNYALTGEQVKNLFNNSSAINFGN